MHVLSCLQQRQRGYQTAHSPLARPPAAVGVATPSLRRRSAASPSRCWTPRASSSSSASAPAPAPAPPVSTTGPWPGNSATIESLPPRASGAGNETAHIHGACQDGECTRFWPRITTRRQALGAHGSGCHAPRDQGWPFLRSAARRHRAARGRGGEHADVAGAGHRGERERAVAAPFQLAPSRGSAAVVGHALARENGIERGVDVEVRPPDPALFENAVGHECVQIASGGQPRDAEVVLQELDLRV